MRLCREMNALFDKGRRDALKGAVASGDLSQMLRKQAGPVGTPGPLSVFIPKLAGVPMEEAIRRADEAGVVIASNKKIDSLLNSDYWEYIKGAFQCWTGTMAGYVEPGKSFREAGEWVDALKRYAIIYVDEETEIRYLFPIPEEHLDKKDSILVTEHPGFKLETDGNDRIVRAAKVDLIERFPAANSPNSQYLADQQFGIPFGGHVPYAVGNLARKVFRIERRVGLVARGFDFSYDYCRRDVGLYDTPSHAFGVAVESNSG